MNPYNMSEPGIPDENEERSRQSKSEKKEFEVNKSFSKISQCIKDIPLLTKVVTIIIITVFISIAAIPGFGFDFVSFPDDLLHRFEIQRLFCGSYIVTKWYNLALIIIFWIPKVIQFEKSIGTIRYFFLFCINTIGIQLLYTISSYIFYHYVDYQMSLLPGRKLSYRQSVGLIPYILMELTIDFIANQQTSTNIAWSKFKVHSIVPLLMLFFLSVCLNSQMFIQLSLGIVYGFIYYHCLRKFFYLQDDIVLKFEKGCLSKRCGFISAKDAQDYNQRLIEEHNKSLLVNNNEV